jgi:o-succinylbenzoate---CoA ligase
MPLAHVGGLGIVVRSLAYETPLVVMEGGFDAGRLLELAETTAVTHVSLVPTMLARVLDVLERRAWPRSIARVLLGGAACPESLLERALSAGLPIHPTYGLTETCGQVATRRALTGSSAEGRSMDLLPGVEVRIVDGAVSVRTPAAFDGWLDEPRSPLDADGFYATGDLGELALRRLVVHARRTDLIVTGGENVYPREIEDALERVPGVRAACVFAVPDVRWGQRVAAAIVAEPDLEDAAILRHLASELASFKTPRLFARLSALPLGPTGKLDRRATASLALPQLQAADLRP